MDEIIFDEFEGEKRMMFLENLLFLWMSKEWESLYMMISCPVVDFLSNVLKLILVCGEFSILEGRKGVFFIKLDRGLFFFWSWFHRMIDLE